MTGTISELLRPEHIVLAIEGRRKADVIAELVAPLAASGTLSDAQGITDAVLEREKLVTTAIGGGIAMPHCLSPLVDGPHVVFGRASGGIKFDAVDKQPVRLFFLLAGREDGQTEHLRLLSKLARLLHDPDLKAGLLAAPDEAAVIDLFRRRESGGGR